MSDINKIDKNGNNALHLAAISNLRNYSILHTLIQHGINLNAQNNDGETPLFCAYKTYQYETASILLQYGADINIKNNKSQTVLSISAGSMFADGILINYFASKKRKLHK